MYILLIMTFGIFIGYKYFNESHTKINSIIQTLCTAILIFSMGVSLGFRENFFNEIYSLGFKSLMFSVFPIIFSVIFVFILSKILTTNTKEKNK